MAINSLGSSALLNQSILNIKNQLNTAQLQLSTGEKGTTYSAMGSGEEFAISARAQLAEITGFQNASTNATTTIDAANTALQSLADTASQVQQAASTADATVNSNGQSTAQTSAVSELQSMVSLLNTQGSNGFIFSGNAINTPSVASAGDILNGTGAQAGLTQVISERQQADLGANGLGRLTVSAPSATSVSLTEDTSPFGLKLNSVTSTLTGATVTGPTGTPGSISIALGGTNPNPGDQISFTLNLPDGTSQTVQLTATNTSPPPAGSFTIGTTSAATATNLQNALTSSISTVANTSLVAASAMEATTNFFDWSATASGSAVNNQLAAPITGATLLSGGAGTDSLTTGFAPGDTITVNGTPITFVASGATGNQVNVTDSVQTLTAKIDSITGTTTPSTISNGAITLNGGANNTPLTVTSSDPAALAALGFSTAVNATPAPQRVDGPPFDTATSLVNGTAANTVSWYTGGTTTGSPLATQSAQIASGVSVQFGIQANESAIVSQLQAVAAFAAFTTSASNPNASAQVAALGSSVAQALTTQPGQQTIADIQTALANATTTIQSVTAQQTQTQTTLQNVISQVETVSPDQVATQLLALQNSLQASYETTSTLSQLSLLKFLPIPDP
jgi:flagellin-like hook-associated protein FlgL